MLSSAADFQDKTEAAKKTTDKLNSQVYVG